MATKTTTKEEQAIKDARLAEAKVRRAKMNAFLRKTYEDTGLVQQTTFNHPNLKMDETIHGADVTYKFWCEKEAERIGAAKGRKAGVMTYDGKVALFVDNCTGEEPDFNTDE